MQLVRDQDPGRALEQAADAAVQQVPPHVSVHRRQRVVQKDHISARVAGPCQRDALPLTAAEIDAFLANLRLIACQRKRGYQNGDRSGRVRTSSGPCHAHNAHGMR